MLAEALKGDKACSGLQSLRAVDHHGEEIWQQKQEASALRKLNEDIKPQGLTLVIHFP